MAKINTLNYQTVASWNGSQDLFVVEQPDGTKVATPAMVKQFIQAGDFEATGEVKDGHGNILKDMAKSADVNTALAGKQNTLTFDNVPTENSSNPVKSGGIFSALAPILEKVNFTLYNQTYRDWNDFPIISIGFGVTGQSNSPGKNSFVICFGTDAGSTPVKIQIAFAADASSQKYRVYIGTTWSAWTAF